MQINNLTELIQRMRRGDARALSRLMTLVETTPETIPCIMGEIYTGRTVARKIGVAGPPGAGKSTLVASLIQRANSLGKRTGVLCIDPTSPITGGAILGDRVRMSIPEIRSETFIRSVASGDSLGGIAAATRFHAILLEASGAELIIIETVGIGQLGYDIRHLVGTLLLVLVPESGDSIQTIKSGITELADIIVVNKADRDGAEQMAETIGNNIPEARDGWRIPVVLTSAMRGEGIDELWDRIEAHEKHIGGGVPHARRDDAACDFTEALVSHLKRELTGGFIETSPLLMGYLEEIKGGKLDPYTASKLVFNAAFNKGK